MNKLRSIFKQEKRFYAQCMGCLKNKPPHCTRYSEAISCFPLCEDCWTSFTIEERMPYYMALCNRWDLNYHDPVKREMVRQAVLAGK